ncbi:tetratricopeptide repeat protein [Pyxidicoccus trucidator]|uniref:tetratricopeptide repeat protein n=1 Tax=Pyxidicoccus trucidator TaxID=2709662 RepID=UPI0013DCA37F|nr:tetratricopeptide repeat protein [Pyxidicoccus trucidator]
MSVPVPPRPMCFVAMPFGTKTPPGLAGPAVHFDEVWQGLKAVLERQGLEAIRADEELMGGFIHRPMYERLVVSEYVIADLTFSNANVAYEVGVRHGASRGATVLICEQRSLAQLPFDFRALRVVPYDAGSDGHVTTEAMQQLEKTLTERIQQARRGELPPDNPLIQVTRIGPGSIAHDKTDVFLLRTPYVNAMTERIGAALTLKDKEKALAQLESVRAEILKAPQEVAQLHTVLLHLFIAYREKGEFQRLVDLYPHLPAELQRTPVAREQLALALNRLAEAAAKAKDFAGGQQLRAQALEVVRTISPEQQSSETFGILGRIYKGLADAEQQAGNTAEAQAAVKKAIQAYEDGFRKDPRDYYPGVNAVTLRIVRGRAEDEVALKRLLPVVRFSVDRAPAPNSQSKAEAYWQEATRLELACAERDWPSVEQHVEALLGLGAEPWMQSWMYETTSANLKKQRDARSGEPETVRQLEGILQKLMPKTS